MKKTGIELIAQERQRQIEKEGYTPEHDKKMYLGEDLAMAAEVYATPAEEREFLPPAGDYDKRKNPPVGWPWAIEWWKPTPNDRVRELVKAGALYMAENDRRGDDYWGPEIKRLADEIDRLQRKEVKP